MMGDTKKKELGGMIHLPFDLCEWRVELVDGLGFAVHDATSFYDLWKCAETFLGLSVTDSGR